MGRRPQLRICFFPSSPLSSEVNRENLCGLITARQLTQRRSKYRRSRAKRGGNCVPGLRQTYRPRALESAPEAKSDIPAERNWKTSTLLASSANRILPTMFATRALRTSLRATRPSFVNIPPACRPAVARAFHASAAARSSSPKSKTKDEEDAAAAGQFARTEGSITVQYPEEGELPASRPVKGAGRAGAHVLPTLAAFSLQGRVGVVTGGARGLGLVMGQGMVISGADLAIVDLNSTCESFESIRGTMFKS